MVFLLSNLGGNGGYQDYINTKIKWREWYGN